MKMAILVLVFFAIVASTSVATVRWLSLSSPLPPTPAEAAFQEPFGSNVFVPNWANGGGIGQQVDGKGNPVQPARMMRMQCGR